MSRRAALGLQLAMVDPDTWEFRQLKHSERWSIDVPRAICEEVKRRAAAGGRNPSFLVQEALVAGE